MKFFLILYFSLQLITNNTFVEDIARIPSLIEHYHHHAQQETPNISFLDFMLLHYSTNKKGIDSDASHDSLPLKHANDIGHIHLISAFTVPDSQLTITFIPLEIKHFTRLSLWAPNQNPDGIFQPPKHC